LERLEVGKTRLPSENHDVEKMWKKMLFGTKQVFPDMQKKYMQN
jgi:hypothetical protein